MPQCDKPRRACERGVRVSMGYSAGMASDEKDGAPDSGDFDRLARRYLDLWQNQLSGVASDQALTEQIARLFAAANAQLASVLQAAQGAPHATSASGASPSAAAPQHGADDLGELRKRLAALEARLAELEARLDRA